MTTTNNLGVTLLEQSQSQKEVTINEALTTFDALVSFTFNLGGACLQRSTLRRVLNRGDYDAVPVQMQRYVWGGGRRLPGLIARREAETNLYQQVN